MTPPLDTKDTEGPQPPLQVQPELPPQGNLRPLETIKTKEWNISFNGSQDPVEFLERLEEVAASKNVPLDRMLSVLPELFKGEASLWFRNNRCKWTSWSEFVSSFKNLYYPVNYQEELEVEISRRLQKTDEPTSSYLTGMQTLIRRLGTFSDAQRLRWLYRNLLPEYRLHIRRTDFYDEETLIQAMRQLEALKKELRPKVRNEELLSTSDAASVRPIAPKPQTRCEGCSNFRPSGNEGKGPRKIVGSKGRREGILTKECKTHLEKGTENPVASKQTSSTQTPETPVTPQTNHPRLGVTVPPAQPPIPEPRREAGPPILSQTQENRPHVTVYLLGGAYLALIDTGAAKNFIGDHLADLCRMAHISPRGNPTNLVRMANGQVAPVSGAYDVEFFIGDKGFREEMVHLPHLAADMVLGMEFLCKGKFWLNLQDRQLWLDHQLLASPATLNMMNHTEDSTRRDPLVLTASEENHLQRFLEKELPKFEEIKGPTPLIHHHIRLMNTDPIKQRYRPQNPRMQEVINTEVDKMLEEGIIEPSNSPWSSPVVIVRKKDGQPRFCVDFQKVNAVSEKDAYPLPFINGILDKLRQARYISSIDLKQGYWQIPLTDSSKPATAFTVPGRGLFHFNVMPFGLHAAPSTFQRLMDRIIGPELDPKCFAYLDDIIVLGETFEEHLQYLAEVFRRLREANLRINPQKCQFGRRTLTYLGHVISPEGIGTDPEKVAAILRIPEPKSVRGLRQFLGVASWYRRFVPDFARIAAPLHRLLKKSQPWSWGEEQTEAFKRLKRSLTRAPVLACPNFERPFTLQTDASAEGIGAALTQNVDGGDHVIAYASRTLTATEKKYSVTEKECLAIVWGIEKMRPYLEGYHFTVLTDHQSLRWLQTIKSPSGRLARWCMYLQQFDFEIKYRKGVLNRIADTLSRNPLPPAAAAEGELVLLENLNECPWYSAKKAEVQKDPMRHPDFCIRNQLLFRHFLDHRPKEELTDPWKLCVPKPHRSEVMRENHDVPTAGHMGVAKTIARIAEHYYWPGMFRDIAKYVKSCDSCQRYKTSQQKTPGLMQPSRNNNPWHTVCTDLVGPLPRSSRGNNYLVVFQDRFTKWVQCRPIRNATAKTVTTALYEEVIMKFGCPHTVITDNGTQFVGKTFTDLLKDLSIQHRPTPPYSPQANPVERTNKTVKTMIAQFCEAEHKKWDQHLYEVTFALNTASHDSTGYSPAFLNFGRELDRPKALYRTATEDTESAEATPVERNAHTDRLQKLQGIFDLVRINLARAFTEQSRQYNLRHRSWKCSVGDKVMKRDNPLSSAVKGFAAKLAPKYSGPYTVTRVVSPVVYDLRDERGRRYQRIHIKDLKAAY